MRCFIFNLLHITLAHVAQSASEKAAGAAGGIEKDFSGLWVDSVHHEAGNGAGRVIFAGISGALKVIENLLINIAEMLALGEVVKIHLVDLVDDLPHELAGLHVVVGIFENIANYAAAVAGFAGSGEFLQRGKELGVDESKQTLHR